MNSLPQNHEPDYFDGEFDALIGLPPAITDLFSDYYLGYLNATLKYDAVPF